MGCRRCSYFLVPMKKAIEIFGLIVLSTIILIVLSFVILQLTEYKLDFATKTSGIIMLTILSLIFSSSEVGFIKKLIAISGITLVISYLLTMFL